MANAERSTLLAELRERIERMEGRGAGRRRAVLPFGLPDLDGRLPGEGLPLGCLHEFAGASPAFEHAAAPLSFIAGILARLSGPVLWCVTRRDLFAPGLAGAGLDPARVIYAETYKEAGVLPLVEEGLRCPGLAGVVGEVSRISLDASRRLQLAAESSGVTAFLLRRWQAASDAELGRPTAATTRWRIAPLPSADLPCPGVGRGRWRLDLLRCRGAEPSSLVVDACDEKGRLCVPSDLVDRPLAARGRRPAASATG